MDLLYASKMIKNYLRIKFKNNKKKTTTNIKIFKKIKIDMKLQIKKNRRKLMR